VEALERRGALEARVRVEVPEQREATEPLEARVRPEARDLPEQLELAALVVQKERRLLRCRVILDKIRLCFAFFICRS
jgi:hypothetical protein